MPGPLPPPARGFRAASYNIHRCVGTDGRHAPRRIAEVLAEIDADVIALQEVDWKDDPETGLPQPELLALLSGYRAVLGPNLRDHRGHYGNMLLVRGEIGTVRRHDLRHPGREPRGAIEASITVRDIHVRAAATHFGLRGAERRAQARHLAAAILEGTDDPVLLMGDFNDWQPGLPGLRALTAQCRGLGRAASFPARFPLIALDHIMVRGLQARGRLRAHRTRAARRASDHLPVVADIACPASAPAR